MKLMRVRERYVGGKTMNKLINQAARFGVVGVVCFGIDYGLLILLTELGGLDYLLSSGISFSVSVVINYLLSMRFVFQSKKDSNRATEFVMFVALSITGLLLTEALMWAGVELFGLHYMFTKVVVTGVVMVYNFITRKIFLEERGTKE